MVLLIEKNPFADFRNKQRDHSGCFVVTEQLPDEPIVRLPVKFENFRPAKGK